MKKSSFLFFGIVFLLNGIYGLCSGTIYALGAEHKNDLHIIEIDRYDYFAMYWITTSISLYAAFFFIKKYLSKKQPELKKIIFKDIHEYRAFQKVDKSLSSITLIWGMVGLIAAYPFWYLIGSLYNLLTQECGICQLDDDWTSLILGILVVSLPIIFYRVAFYRTINQFKNNETITEDHFFTRIGPSNSLAEFYGRDSDDK